MPTLWAAGKPNAGHGIGGYLAAAAFLASAASDFVTGQTLFVDGGFTS